MSKYIPISLLILVILGLIGYIMWKPSPKIDPVPIQYWEKPDFKTDTLLDTVYLRPKPYPVPVPPRVVILRDTIRDTLYNQIDTLKFLSKFPKSPKLVSGTFTKGEIILDLLRPNGSLVTQVYGTDYENYQYQFQDMDLTTSRIEPKPKPESGDKKTFITYEGLYLNYSRDLLQANHEVSADWGIKFGNKVRVQAFSQMGLSSQSKLQAGVKIGFKLF